MQQQPGAAAAADPLTVFTQYGYVEEKQHDSPRGRQSTGRCPFCGKPGHFGVSITSKNKDWKCFKCGRSGGYSTFVETVVAEAQRAFNGKRDELANARSIGAKTFADVARAGYHASTGAYLLPVYEEDGKKLANVKIYDQIGYRNTAGMRSEMYGLWWMREFAGADTVYVCEGEWDALAMREALESAGKWGVDSGCIGVPGAGTFRQTVLPSFLGKRAVLCYDNDDAGARGRDRAASMLVGVAREVLTVNWPESTPSGYDVRDLYKSVRRNAGLFLEKLGALVKPIKPTQISAAVAVANASAPTATGPHIPAEQVYAAYRKWLHLPDTTMIDVMFGTVFANRIPGDPLWMFIVAVPGATKTEPLLSLSADPRVVTLSSLTPATLVSGMNMGGADPSLLPQLDRRLLVIKEFTSILTMPQMEREEIQGILRDAYDGEYRKMFGNGVVRWYRNLHFGVIAAVTPAIEHYLEDSANASLGERFLCWRNEVPQSLSARRKYIERAMGNVGNEPKMREELCTIAKRVLAAKIDVETLPKVSDALRERVVHLAQLVAMLRGTVARDKYTRDITHRAFTELGTRISKQLLKAIYGQALFRGVKAAGEREYRVVAEIARSSVPSRVLHAIDKAFDNKDRTSTAAEASRALELPTSTCEMILGNLAQLGACERESAAGTKVTYTLKADVIQLLQNGGLAKWQQ